MPRALPLRPTCPHVDPRLRPYLVSAALIAATLGARFLLKPVFGSTHAYTPFYPAIIVVAYAFGRPFATGTALLSAVLAFACFSLPSFDLRHVPAALAGGLLFAANSTVAIYLITGLNRSVQRLAADQGRAEATASAQAEMFRELNERVSHHLQLVSGVLALQARGEPERKVSEALMTASERSILLARIHRELAGRKSAEVDLTPIAAKLVRALLASRGHATDLIVVDGPAVRLSEEEATSMAVALLESVGVLLSHPPRPVRITLASSAEAVVLRLRELDPSAGMSLTRLANAYLLRAAVEQASGVVSLSPDGHGSALELTFPRLIAGPEPTTPGPETLH